MKNNALSLSNIGPKMIHARNAEKALFKHLAHCIILATTALKSKCRNYL